MPASTPIYIRAAEQISMQAPLSTDWLAHPLIYGDALVPALDPDYSAWLDRREVRRMSPIIKRALVTALKVLETSEIQQPEAIITGTAMGCLDYSERFLKELSTGAETGLSPTYFMQSTHNTIGATLSIYTGTKGYNSTYAHGHLSFELALLDAYMQLRLGDISNALVGGYDEMTPYYHSLLQRAGSMGLAGMVPTGEVAMSMLLSRERHRADLAELVGIRLVEQPTVERLETLLGALLREGGLTERDISLVFMGSSGHPADEHASALLRRLLPNSPQEGYKQVFGENFTASALGLYAAAHRLKAGIYSGAVLQVSYEGERAYALTLLKALEPPTAEGPSRINL